MVSVPFAQSVQRCIARTKITMKAETITQIRANEMKKGDVLGTARFAGLHSVHGPNSSAPEANQNKLTMDFAVSDSAVEITSTALASNVSRARSMALTGAAVAALTIYDMCKSIDRTMVIEKLGIEASSTFAEAAMPIDEDFSPAGDA